MPNPPPPPPPGPGPLPPPMFAPSAAADDGQVRNMLLSSIRQGAALKKTVTNDKSGPLLAGKHVLLTYGLEPDYHSHEARLTNSVTQNTQFYL